MNLHSGKPAAQPFNSETAEYVERLLLVSDIPPCSNYSGGIYLNNILASIEYQVCHAFVVLNPRLEPLLPRKVIDRMSIVTVRKPNEAHDPSSSDSAVRDNEIRAERHIRHKTLPALLKASSEFGATGYWFLLEGQSMIRLAYELMNVTDLPVTVQVADPPSDWLRVHNVDEATRAEVLQKYDYVLHHAHACAAASWTMAERYGERYGIPCFPVHPSLSGGLARGAARSPAKRSTFKIAMAGQIYAREEWNVLISALQTLGTVKRKPVELHAFTREPVEHDVSPGVPFRQHPWVSTEDLLESLETMDLLYCPYRFGEVFREESELCFPSKLTTYLAAGRPVLFHGPEYASPAKFLQAHDAAFSCHTLDPAELVSVVERAMEDGEEHERIATNGVRAFRDRLSHQHAAASIRAALNWRGLDRKSVEGRSDGSASSQRTPPSPTATPSAATAAGQFRNTAAAGRRLVLVIGMAESVHVARWMNMVSRCPGLRFILCPVFPTDAVQNGINAALGAVRVIRDAEAIADMPEGEIGVFDLDSVSSDDLAAARRATGFKPYHPTFLPSNWRFTEPGHVAAAIARLKPALVISLEVQFAGYLTLATKDYMGGAGFPSWLLSNWGSDIYLYRKLKDHEPRLRRIAESIDAYAAECERDVAIVRRIGFRGQVLPTMPASGGADFSEFPALADLQPPSSRREIHIKGYHGWSGRALHILAAVHMAAAALSKFAIRISLAGPDVHAVADLMAQRDGLDIACEPYVANHAESIARLARSRLSVGMGISDGISTTLLESMAVGTFPLKGSSSCACEWVENGRTGMVVSPHDTRALAEALARAASDDELVDAAAPINRATVEQRWDADQNRRIIEGHLLELAS